MGSVFQDTNVRKESEFIVGQSGGHPAEMIEATGLLFCILATV